MARSAPSHFIIKRNRAGSGEFVLAELFDPILASDAFDAAIAAYSGDELVMTNGGEVVSHHDPATGSSRPRDRFRSFRTGGAVGRR